MPACKLLNIHIDNCALRTACVMSWSQDLSITWFRHVTTHIIYSNNLNIWLMYFILRSSRHRHQHPRHYSHVMTISWSVICYICTTSSSWSPYYYNTCFQSIVGLEQGAWRSIRKIISRSTPIRIWVVVAWEEYPWPLLMKATGGSYSEWWVRRLARCSTNPTLEDVNIRFKHLLYNLISRVDGRVVS